MSAFGTPQYYLQHCIKHVLSFSSVLAQSMVKSEPLVSVLDFQDNGWLAHVKRQLMSIQTRLQSSLVT